MLKQLWWSVCQLRSSLCSAAAPLACIRPPPPLGSLSMRVIRQIFQTAEFCYFKLVQPFHFQALCRRRNELECSVSNASLQLVARFMRRTWIAKGFPCRKYALTCYNCTQTDRRGTPETEQTLFQNQSQRTIPLDAFVGFASVVAVTLGQQRLPNR